MFENQVEQYIAKALLEEAKKDGAFLNESEIAFRVTGMMYQDKIKSDGPVSLRSVKGKMSRVRTLCDEQSKILLPKMETDRGGDQTIVVGWKIASGADLDYIAETFLGIKPKPQAAEKPAAEPTPEPEA